MVMVIMVGFIEVNARRKIRNRRQATGDRRQAMFGGLACQLVGGACPERAALDRVRSARATRRNRLSPVACRLSPVLWDCRTGRPGSAFGACHATRSAIACRLSPVACSLG
jgi:hypothetical protein